MRSLLRQPLTWIVIAECIVVTLLIVVVWNVVAAAAASTQRVAGSVAQGPSTQTSSPAAPPPADVAQASKAARPVQLPGLNLNSGFWRVRLGQLNSDQVVFEQLEWRLVHSAMDAAQGYLETVVLPSITRAERP